MEQVSTSEYIVHLLDLRIECGSYLDFILELIRFNSINLTEIVETDIFSLLSQFGLDHDMRGLSVVDILQLHPKLIVEVHAVIPTVMHHLKKCQR